MRLERSNKRYISKLEASVICSVNGHNLPRKKFEILHSRQVNLQSDIIGRDDIGYYIQNVNIKALIIIDKLKRKGNKNE